MFELFIPELKNYLPVDYVDKRIKILNSLNCQLQIFDFIGIKYKSVSYSIISKKKKKQHEKLNVYFAD